MAESQIWDIDRVAAGQLLAELGLAGKVELVDRAAGVLARHRRDACEWAACKVHAAIVAALESGSRDAFARHDVVWADGFRHAESAVLARDPVGLLGLRAGEPLSRGQVLRSMIRSAKRAGQGPNSSPAVDQD